MHKKPTKPFGHVAFGKDGGARKHMEILSSDKKEQEQSVGRRFCAMLELVSGESCEYRHLEENDNDFKLAWRGQMITVEATEVVSREYLHPIDMQDYLCSRHSYSEFVCEGPSKIYGVDQRAREEVVLNKIKNKLPPAKHYGKRKDPFWLLVWTVSPELQTFYYCGGQQVVSSGITMARNYLSCNGAGPFDEIWFFYLGTRPQCIWPTKPL